MTKKGTSRQFCDYLKILLLPLILIGISGCGSSSSSSSSGSGSCDVVANAAGPAFLRVENSLNSGLSWEVQGYPFESDMKPDECNIFGLSASQHTVELTQCNIGGGACTSEFGQTVLVVFAVATGETYILDVKSSTF